MVQICIWPSWCHCHSLSLALVKSRLVLVPAHPGNPRQSPQGCKMDVCVRACVCACVSCHIYQCTTIYINMVTADTAYHMYDPNSIKVNSNALNSVLKNAITQIFHWKKLLHIERHHKSISWAKHHYIYEKKLQPLRKTSQWPIFDIHKNPPNHCIYTESQMSQLWLIITSKHITVETPQQLTRHLLSVENTIYETAVQIVKR